MHSFGNVRKTDMFYDSKINTTKETDRKHRVENLVEPFRLHSSYCRPAPPHPRLSVWLAGWLSGWLSGCLALSPQLSFSLSVLQMKLETKIGTISKATLGTFLTDGVERIWAFPGAEIPS